MYGSAAITTAQVNQAEGCVSLVRVLVSAGGNILQLLVLCVLGCESCQLQKGVNIIQLRLLP